MVHSITFKEIETTSELRLFQDLRKFHYRGGGGAGRVVPIIASSETWDLPELLGFIEISSSMIANTARKQFFDYPYRETSGKGWQRWDRAAAKTYSNMIARISRFVIHPEIRGLGLARHFLKAAITYAEERWHYGGFKPRFLEITADMLRYYKFVGAEFIYQGQTEGNEHRLSKDMAYLVKKGLSPKGIRAMPQGGGGIMTMQRSYASRVMKYMETHNRSFPDVVNSLSYEPEHLDQETWEALYRLNRRPKPCYTAGLTDDARAYLLKRSRMLSSIRQVEQSQIDHNILAFSFTDVSVIAHSKLAQSNDSRRLQDTFGFVGSALDSEIIQPTSFVLPAGDVTLVCGASGSGKSLLGAAIRTLCGQGSPPNLEAGMDGDIQILITGSVTPRPRYGELEPLEHDRTALEQVKNLNLESFIETTAKCGLAEPQLFVRPVSSLSSGQKYRLQVAFAFLKRPNILHIDNFCETLDRLTVVAVCKGLKSLASSYNVAVMVSTAAYERLIRLLRPNHIILLRRGNSPLTTTDITEVLDAL